MKPMLNLIAVLFVSLIVQLSFLLNVVHSSRSTCTHANSHTYTYTHMHTHIHKHIWQNNCIPYNSEDRLIRSPDGSVGRIKGGSRGGGPWGPTPPSPFLGSGSLPPPFQWDLLLVSGSKQKQSITFTMTKIYNNSALSWWSKLIQNAPFAMQTLKKSGWHD